MPKLTIDNQEIEVENGTVIIQAAERLGIEIPRFCYHERLNIAGNCRMCLVEVSPGPPKPQASCALPCAEGMVVKTNTEMVKKAREGVMEFLLINHPLDCPICDQAGECDLQDQSLFYGKGESRYHEEKRSVEDKYMGPIVKTNMTRCIHCTRCVRFSTEIAGVPELGAFGRGEHMEVGTYVEKALTSELSGNLVDLCPVGALTSKPYAFVARPWELTHTESIDVMDAVGSNIRIDSRGPSVLRVLPRVHEDVNEEWLSDKSRHACDGLRLSRLDTPYVRGEDGKLKPASWPQALQSVASRLSTTAPAAMAALAGNLACAESMQALKDLMLSLGVANLDCRQEGAFLPYAERGDYLLNTTIAGLEEADCVLLIGCNPRLEAPLVNTRLRKAALNGAQVYNLGTPADLTYDVTQLGNDPRSLRQIAEGQHPLCDALREAKRPVLLLGTAALARGDGEAVYMAARAIADEFGLVREGWNGFNVLHHAASRVGALDVGFVPQENGRGVADIYAGCQSGEISLVYLLGVDEIDMALLGKAFVIYQGHHGDAGAHRADVILPGAAYTEKSATYVNTEGRVQRTQRAVFPPGEAKEDWAILRGLSSALGRSLPYDSLAALRNRMAHANPVFATLDETAPAPLSQALRPRTPLSSVRFEPLHANFYQTDPISRASRTMAECTKEQAAVSLQKAA